jgi:isochorismate synthase
MHESNKITSIISPLQFKEDELLIVLFNYAAEQEYSFACWRLPNSTQKNLIISYTPYGIPANESLEELPEGFLFAPFDKGKNSTYLKADLTFSFTDGNLEEATTPLQSKSYQWLQEIIPTLQKKKFKPRYKDKKDSSLPPVSQKENFEHFVKKCIDQIEAGSFEKIVPSRAKRVDLKDSFDVIEVFQKLCFAYPNAMVSFIHTPEAGAWIGASPELLVSVENKTNFKTVALAGTKMFEEGTNLKQVAWTQKEIEEQALVSRYIINNFKKIRLREFEEHGPKTVVAGNLMHLKTEFAVDMKATNFPQLGSVMLNLLHPTSAVCGMPLEPSLEFLQQHEGYDREFYSGYLGPVNVDNNIHLFVNLRCMQLLKEQAIVYAGAGVTSDSVPETEWEETEMKLNTLLKVIL